MHRPSSPRTLRIALLAACGGLFGLGFAGCRRSPPPPAAPTRSAVPPTEAPHAPPTVQLDEELLLGRERERGPETGGIDRYRVALQPGELLALRLRQDGLDIAVTLLDPAGKVAVRSDSLNGGHGFEIFSFLARERGEHRIEVVYPTPLSSRSGRYRLLARVDPRPGLVDREAAKASLWITEADANRQAGDGATRCASGALYASAGAAWHRAGLREAEALAEARWGVLLADCAGPRAALPHLERAAELHRQVRSEGGLPEVLVEIGKSHRSLGEVADARSALESARSAARRSGAPHAEASALNSLALLAKEAGELWESLVLFEEALRVFRELGSEVDTASVLHNRGRLLMEVGKLDEARAAFEEALALQRKNGNASFAARTANELAWVRFLQGDRAAARHSLEEALAVQRKVGDPLGEAQVLDRMGTLAQSSGDGAGAVTLYRQALAIQIEKGEPRSAAYTRSNLGEALLLSGDPLGALREIDRAIGSLAASGELEAEAYSRFRRAKIQRALGSLEKARGDSAVAIELLERIRTGAASDALRAHLVDWVHELYELQVDLLMEMHALHPDRGFDGRAFEAAERSRSRTLLDLIQNERKRSVGAAGQPVDRLRQIEDQLRILEVEAQAPAALESAGSPERAGSDALGQLLAERERLRVELRRATIGRARAPKRISLHGAQGRLLDAETTLLVYALGEERSYIWAVTGGSLRSAVLPSRRDIEEGARRFHELAAGNSSEIERRQLRLTARHLSEMLLLPVAPLLTSRRLAVVADGALAYVPFQLLPEPAKGDDPVLDRHEVVILPSVAVLRALRERAATRIPPPRRIAVLADPLFLPPGAAPPRPGTPSAVPKTDPALAVTLRATSGATRDLGLGYLAPLPYSRREAEAIVRLDPSGQAFAALGPEASLQLATSSRLGAYRTVHFATHALIHPSNPDLSGVVLSLYDRAGRPQPGFLLSYRILDLDLPAELVVLSACRTALGQELKGEGLVGLTQGFFHAGATRVLVSLWNVDDEATALLMTRFYEGLFRRHLPPAAALRQAQISLRSDPKWSAPFYWAGFELQGDWIPFD